MKLTIPLIKVVHLIQYSNKKTNFREINLILNLKNWHWNQKYPAFDSSQSNSLRRYQKILWRCSFGCKSLSNFFCLTMKFHNCHHTNARFFTTIPYFYLVLVPLLNRKMALDYSTILHSPWENFLWPFWHLSMLVMKVIQSCPLRSIFTKGNSSLAIPSSGLVWSVIFPHYR